MIGIWLRLLVGADGLGELEAVHVRHLDVGQHHVEVLRAQRGQSLLRVDRDPHPVAGGLQHRRQHVAEERRVVDQQHRLRRRRRPHLLAREPVGKRHRQEVADVDHLGGLALDHGRAENALAGAGDLDVQLLLDDVDDLVDHEPHRAAVVGEHQDRLRPWRLDVDPVHLHQRHQLLAVLHHVAAVTEFDLVGGDLLQPGDEAERHRLGLGRAGAEHQ